jgi:hypothetical protein
MISINNVDVFSIKEFKDKFLPTDIPSFLLNEYMWAESEDYTVFNGIMLIGICTCGCQGCDDLIVKITSNEKTTTWEIKPDRDDDIKICYVFDASEYKNQIEQLKNKYYSYSWENENHKIRRICTEYIRTFITKNGKTIEAVKIPYSVDEKDNYTDKLSDIIEIYFYDDWEPMGDGYGTPYRSWKINWDGKTLESALNNLKIFAKKELIKNNNEVNPRPYPFRLLYTKDKNIIQNSL